MAKQVNPLYILGAGSGLAVVPFLVLVAFWHPLGTHAVDWASNWGEQFVGVSWWEQQMYWYNTTMGRYASTAMMSSTSYWYTLGGARLLVGLLNLGVGVASWRLLRAVFPSLRRATVTVVTLSIAALFVQQLSSPYDTFYRLSGLLTYQAGLIAFLVATRLFLRKKWWLAVPVIFFAVGTNEITLLHCGALCGLALLFYPSIRKTPGGVAVLLISLAGAAIALLAPGNWVRSTYYDVASPDKLHLIALVAGVSIFTWAGWIGSTVLVPLLLLLRPYLPLVKASRFQTIMLLLLTLLWLPVSLAPVIIATQGDSLPEGIVDWQIIPVFMLLLWLSATMPTYKLPAVVKFGLVLFITGSFFLTGLGIDRGRDRVYASSVDRIEISSPAGRAWLQLLRGTPNTFSQSAFIQYEAIRNCTAEICLVPPMEGTEENFLYDPLYDRRTSGSGDRRFGYLFGQGGKSVKVQPLR